MAQKGLAPLQRGRRCRLPKVLRLRIDSENACDWPQAPDLRAEGRRAMTSPRRSGRPGIGPGRPPCSLLWLARGCTFDGADVFRVSAPDCWHWRSCPTDVVGIGRAASLPLRCQCSAPPPPTPTRFGRSSLRSVSNTHQEPRSCRRALTWQVFPHWRLGIIVALADN